MAELKHENNTEDRDEVGYTLEEALEEHDQLCCELGLLHDLIIQIYMDKFGWEYNCIMTPRVTQVFTRQFNKSYTARIEVLFNENTHSSRGNTVDFYHITFTYFRDGKALKVEDNQCVWVVDVTSKKDAEECAKKMDDIAREYMWSHFKA